MTRIRFTFAAKLYWRKTQGCCREFGLTETIRRVWRELIRALKKSDGQLDITLITENLAVGSAPKSFDAVTCLRLGEYKQVIDMRAERKESDVLVETTDVSVQWIPTYDDWRPKSSKFYQMLSASIERFFSSENKGKLFVCCGAGEHRAPLGGIVALLIMGHSLESAIEKIQKARAKAELLPVYIESLKEFLASSSDYRLNRSLD